MNPHLPPALHLPKVAKGGGISSQPKHKRVVRIAPETARLPPTHNPNEFVQFATVAKNYGYMYRPDPIKGPKNDLASDARPSQATAKTDVTGDENQRAGEDDNDVVSRWPSGKAGSKPNLLTQLEHYLHEQLTILHHCQGQDRETIAVIRGEMVKHCLDVFRTHFRTYRQIFTTLFDSVDGIMSLFDVHREQMSLVREEVDKQESKFASAMKLRDEHEERLRQEIMNLGDLAHKFGPLEEDRKVLNALTEDQQRQLQRNKLQIESLNERLENLSRLHVTATMREDRLKNKIEGYEKQLHDIEADMQALEKQKKDSVMQLELTAISLHRREKEKEEIETKFQKSEYENNKFSEEIKMLHFEKKRLLLQMNQTRGGGGEKELQQMYAEMQQSRRGSILTGGDAAQHSGTQLDRQQLTPRPNWNTLLAPQDLPPKLKSPRNSMVRLVSSSGDDANASSGNNPIVRPLSMGEMEGSLSIASMPTASPASSPPHKAISPMKFSASPSPPTTVLLHHPPPAGASQHQDALIQSNLASNAVAYVTNVVIHAGVSMKNKITSEELDGLESTNKRVEYLCESLVTARKQADELRGELTQVQDRNQTLEEVSKITSQPSLFSQSEQTRVGSPFTGAPQAGLTSQPTSVRKKVSVTLSDKVFIPCGESEDIPFYLRTSLDNNNIQMKPLQLHSLLDYIFDAMKFIAQKYLEVGGTSNNNSNPPSSPLSSSDAVAELSFDYPSLMESRMDSLPLRQKIGKKSFSEGFYQWAVLQQQLLQQLSSGVPSSGRSPQGSGMEGKTPRLDSKEKKDGGVDGSAFAPPLLEGMGLELSYSMLYLAQHTYASNIYCRMFLYLLSEEIPMTTFLHWRAQLRRVRRVFEKADPNGAEVVTPGHAMHLLQTECPGMSEYELRVLTEALISSAVTSSPGQQQPGGATVSSMKQSSSTSNPSERGRGAVNRGNISASSPTALQMIAIARQQSVDYPRILHRDSPFLQAICMFFLAHAFYNIRSMSKAIREMRVSSEELPFQGVLQALLKADPQNNGDNMTNYIATCINIHPQDITKKTKVNHTELIEKLSQVYMERASPINVGLFRLDYDVDPPLIVQIQVQPSLHSAGATIAPSQPNTTVSSSSANFLPPKRSTKKVQK